MVTDRYSPGLSRCRICAAPSSFATAVAFSYSGSSRSKSSAFSEYRSTTCWYAAAVAAGVPQVCPSLVPPYPPMDTDTSPPLARIRPITAATAVSAETAAVPSQVGEQPPPLGARMKASWNAFCPLAFMTVTGSGGSLSSGIRYGAAAYQFEPRAPAAGVGPARVTAAAAAGPTAARARGRPQIPPCAGRMRNLRPWRTPGVAATCQEASINKLNNAKAATCQYAATVTRASSDAATRHPAPVAGGRHLAAT